MITTGIASISTGFISNSVVPSTNPLRVENKMGRGPNCTGRGLCSLTTEKPDSKSSTADFSSDIFIDKQGRLVMQISREDLTVEMISEQFKNNQLILTDEFELPAELTKGMGVKDDYSTIPAGNYPVEITDDEVIITFDLEQS